MGYSFHAHGACPDCRVTTTLKLWHVERIPDGPILASKCVGCGNDLPLAIVPGQLPPEGLDDDDMSGAYEDPCELCGWTPPES